LAGRLPCPPMIVSALVLGGARLVPWLFNGSGGAAVWEVLGVFPVERFAEQSLPLLRVSLDPLPGEVAGEVVLAGVRVPHDGAVVAGHSLNRRLRRL
jgi:hypothetical protein